MSTLTIAAPVYALEIRAAGTESPTRARHWLAWVLEAAGIAQDTIDAAVLAVSELVTNAVVHTDTARILVSAELAEDGIRLVVHDDAAPLDGWQRPSGVLAERGRGLVIVQALAAELTIDRHAAGTSVTAVIAR